MAKKLTDPWFKAKFYGNNHVHSFLPSIEGAQGVTLWCPCAYPNDKSAHWLYIPFENPRNAPPLLADHGPLSRDGTHHPRWTMTGTSLDDLTLTPSVDVGDEPACWHGFITNGEVTP